MCKASARLDYGGRLFLQYVIIKNYLSNGFSPMESIAPLNVLIAMFVLQIVLFSTMLLGVAMDSSRSGASRSPGIYIFLFFSFVVCLLLLVFTDEVYAIWKPMVRDLYVPTLPRASGKLLAFSLNYLTVAFLILYTGRRNSPLMPILFLLPTVSIFLRDLPSITLVYGGLSAVYYLALSCQGGGKLPRFMAPPEPLLPSMAMDRADGYGAHRIVAILCLAITLIIGYITRPVPVA
jgi:hypothetical protein